VRNLDKWKFRTVNSCKIYDQGMEFNSLFS
jgi:hypothetical protein